MHFQRNTSLTFFSWKARQGHTEWTTEDYHILYSERVKVPPTGWADISEVNHFFPFFSVSSSRRDLAPSRLRSLTNLIPEV